MTIVTASLVTLQRALTLKCFAVVVVVGGGVGGGVVVVGGGGDGVVVDGGGVIVDGVDHCHMPLRIP